MRVNLPVTQREYELREGAMLVSTTDTKGRITFANEDFVTASGFSETELVGKAHNIVRHPDMPEEAFADLWKTLSAGKPWSALVKNRRKDGDFYWVLANVTPIRTGKEVTGYMSVRSRATREQIATAEDVYRALREKRADGHIIREGRISTRSWRDRLDFLRTLSLPARAALLGLCLILPAMIGVLDLLMGSEPGGSGWTRTAGALLGVLAVAGIMGYVVLCRRIARTLRNSAAQVQELTQGRFEKIFEARGEDELANLQRALQSLRTKVGFELADSRRVAIENTRIRNALDVAAANVMVADASQHIIYTNHSLENMLLDAESDIRKDLPSFDARQLIGSSIKQFQTGTTHVQADVFESSGTNRTRLALGGRQLDVITNPIIEKSGSRLGTVLEWSDRTQELATEQELQDMVSAVLGGNLATRINLSGKAGYFEVMSRGINRLADNMAEVVAKAKSLTREVHRGADEIARGNADLSQRTEEQSSSLEQTAASMEQMTATVRQNAENAVQADKLAHVAREQAEIGGGVVADAIAAMVGINEASAKIANIIGVIDDIAFQTNLLALNAAVEAARAGEQGRGFAVVASEVRNLAGRSAAAAKEIKELITDSVQRVERGSTLVSDSGQTLDTIVASIKKVSEIVAQIAGASSEQSTGIEQVNRAVMQMDQITQQNAALVEQASAASRSLADHALELAQVMEKYRLAGQGGVRDVPVVISDVERESSCASRSPERMLPGRQG